MSENNENREVMPEENNGFTPAQQQSEPIAENIAGTVSPSDGTSAAGQPDAQPYIPEPPVQPPVQPMPPQPPVQNIPPVQAPVQPPVYNPAKGPYGQTPPPVNYSQQYGYNQRPLYGQNQYFPNGQPYNPNKNQGLGNGMAIASLVCGILGIFTSWFCFGILPGVLAVIFGIVALVNRTSYKPMAIAGLITGGIGILLTLFISVIWGIIFAEGGEWYNDYYYDYSYQYPFNDFM